MDWKEGISRILRIDEEELALWERLMATAPNEHIRRMIRDMIAREREEMRMLRELMMDSHMDP